MGQNQSCPTLNEQWNKLDANAKWNMCTSVPERKTPQGHIVPRKPTPPPPSSRTSSPVLSLDISPKKPIAQHPQHPTRTPPPPPPRSPSPSLSVQPPPSPHSPPLADQLANVRLRKGTPKEQPVRALTPLHAEIQRGTTLHPVGSRQINQLPKPTEPGNDLKTAITNAMKGRRDAFVESKPSGNFSEVDKENETDKGKWTGGSQQYLGPYYLKYLKYKNKYIELKKSMH